MISPLSSSGVMSARHALNRTQNALFDVFRRLSTGRRINSGKDDPAGLIASERLAAEVKSLEAENRAIQRADSNARIAEGHAAEMSTLFTDLNGLVVASANSAGMTDGERAANQMQIDNIVSSIRRFQGDAVDASNGLNMPGTGNAEVVAAYDIALAAAASVQSGGANDLSTGNYAVAQTAIGDASTAIATARGRIGGYQKDVLGPRLRSNQVAIENLSESRSRIADTDFALEMSNFTRLKILNTSGIMVLKIVQQQGASVLSLLR